MYPSRSGADGCTEGWRAQHVIEDCQQIGCRIDQGGIMAGRRGTQTRRMRVGVWGNSDVEVGRAPSASSRSTLDGEGQRMKMLHNAAASAETLQMHSSPRLGAAQPRRRALAQFIWRTAHRLSTEEMGLLCRDAMSWLLKGPRAPVVPLNLLRAPALCPYRPRLYRLTASRLYDDKVQRLVVPWTRRRILAAMSSCRPAVSAAFGNYREQ